MQQRQYYQEHRDVKFLAIDYDQTITTGHLHHYFISIFPDKTPAQIDALAGDASWLEKQLLHAAIFSHFMANPISQDMAEKARIKGVFLKNREGDLVAALEQEYDGDFRSIKPFVAKDELVELLSSRYSMQGTQTTILSNSAYKGVIQKTLYMLLGLQSQYISVITPKCDPNLTIVENIGRGIYKVDETTKNPYLEKCKKECGVAEYADMALYDDSSRNVRSASSLGIWTSLIPKLMPIHISRKDAYISFASMGGPAVGTPGPDTSDDEFDNNLTGGSSSLSSVLSRGDERKGERQRLLASASPQSPNGSSEPPITAHERDAASRFGSSTSLCTCTLSFLWCATGVIGIAALVYIMMSFSNVKGDIHPPTPGPSL